MSKPEPKRDKRGVPWCQKGCENWTRLVPWDPRCELTPISRTLSVTQENLCLPQVQLDEAELAEARKRILEME